MRIKTSSVLLLGTIGVLLLIATAATYHIASTDQMRAELAEKINDALDEMVEASVDWGQERSLVQAALGAPEPASEATIANLRVLRRHGKTAFDGAISGLQTRDIVISDDLLARYRQRENWVEGLRARADRALRLPKAARDRELTANWFRVSSEAIDASEQIRIDCGARVAGVISIVVKNLSLRHSLWLMSEYAGRERGLLAGIIASGRPMTTEESHTLAMYRGRVLEGWNVVSHYFADDPRLSASRNQLSALDAGFFGDYEEMRQQVYDEAETGHFRITAAQWLDASARAISRIVDVQNTAEADVRRAAQIEETRDELIVGMTLAIAVAGSAMLALGLGLFLRNVYLPLRRLTEVAEAISDGDGNTVVPFADNTGEIGALARGLQHAQDSMKRRREAEAERLATQEDLARLAHYDPLTGLANRVLFARGIEANLRQLERSGQEFALFCLDLDGFKLVNDTFGHAMGDALLREVAGRIGDALRAGDTLARMGGDEFAIIQAITSGADAQRLASRVIDAIRPAFRINNIDISVGVSIGIALAPDNGHDFISLLARADMAMYKAKADGKNDWRFYDAELDRSLQERMKIENELKHALALNQFHLHYQPLIDVTDNTISGFEALLRWDHPELGQVSPAIFIPIAEETNQICQIGSWVIDQAVHAAANWPQPWRVAINVSPRQFRDRAIMDDVSRALAASGIAPDRIELELTERVIMKNTADNIATLNGLRAMGLRLAMDDFGTGYSSLSYLRHFKFDKIKIDQSFTQGLPDDDEAAAIIRAVTDMAGALGIAVTAEGVETQPQLDMLRALGCDEAQGYLIGAPMRNAATHSSSIEPRPNVARIDRPTRRAKI